jgi:hypothetical protein
MKRIEVKNMITDILKMKLKKTDQDIYIAEIRKRFVESSIKSAEVSQESVMKYLKSLGETPLNQSYIDASLKLTTQIYDLGITQTDKLFIQEQVAKQYVSNREKEITKFKSERKKSEITGIDLDMTNSQVGNIIGYGQVVFLKDYTTDNETSRQLTSLFQEALEKKLTAPETATLLKINLGKEAPKEYVKRFGEARYWEGVAEQHISKARTISDIQNYRDAGFEYLKIYVRIDERTCDICGPKHETIISVGSSVKIIDKYLNAAIAGSSEDMKKAMPWGKTAELPLYHFHCRCYTEPLLESEYEAFGL